MKYKITKTDLLIVNKLHSEGSEIELTKDQTKGIEEFLIPIDSNKNKKEKILSAEVLTKAGRKGNKK